jgi:hypothetical protein
MHTEYQSSKIRYCTMYLFIDLLTTRSVAMKNRLGIALEEKTKVVFETVVKSSFLRMSSKGNRISKNINNAGK